MLHGVKALQGFAVAATDGELGAVKGVYFDDAKWAIRHLVVDTGGWLNERKVLVPPYSVLSMDWIVRIVKVRLTREQIRNSPGIDTVQPVSRRHEAELLAYYGYPDYWTGPALWGYTEFPTVMEREVYEDAQRRAAEQADEQEERADPHLHASGDIIGCDIRATDDTVGHVEDLLFDDSDWSIRMLAVDTRNWWPGKHVLVPRECIVGVDEEGKTVAVDIAREDVEHSPEYDPLRLPQAAPQRDLRP